MDSYLHGTRCGVATRLRVALMSGFIVALVGTATTRGAHAQQGGIIPDKELMITSLAVVDDASRTANSCDRTTAAPGSLPAWSFGRLMKDMSGSHDPSDFTLQWLRTWERGQAINGDVVDARASIEREIVQPWLARSGGRKLDLRKAPFRLLAIAYRPDLRDRTKGKAGEGRFIFGALDRKCRPLEFTVIFEYTLPAESCSQTLRWAARFHALGAIPFGERYNAALEAITEKFTAPRTSSRMPNGSLLSQLRTNEIALGSSWQLREFSLVSTGGRHGALLRPATVKQTPKASLNNSPALRNLINRNQRAILNEAFIVPPTMLGGASEANGEVWQADGILNNDARHKFALNTCSGCHSAETNVSFVHVEVRGAKMKSKLSPFLLGTTVIDPVSGVERSFSEMERRVSDYSVLLNTKCAGRSGPSAQGVSPQASVAAQFYCEAGQPNDPNGAYPAGEEGDRPAGPLESDGSVANPPEITLAGLDQGCVRAGRPLH